MSGLNKVMLIGRLGKDPELKYANNGNAIASFTMATSETWKDKGSGDKKEKTEWHRIVAFGKLGEICGKYLTKGKQIYIEGKLQTRTWEQDGVTRYTTEIVVMDMQMLDSRADQGVEQPSREYGAASKPLADPYTGGRAQPPDDPGDDIPF